MNWFAKLHDDPLSWLLEEDEQNPGVRFFALQELRDIPSDKATVKAAQQVVMTIGPVPVMLAAQLANGGWVKGNAGYSPKYRATDWTVMMLAQLGADGKDPRVKRGCEYVLEKARSKCGGFSINGTPSGMVHCLQGNLVAALIDLGWLGEPHLQAAIDWMGRSVIGEGIAPAEDKDAVVRYYRSGNSAPGFYCSYNNHLPCAWGAVKVMLALSKIPAQQRNASVQAAIQTGVDFLLGKDPVQSDYPTPFGTKPSQSWFKLGFPIFYITDVLQNLEVLTALGYARDERLRPALGWLLSKQDDHGRWKMEHSYNGKMWVDIEQKQQASKWVTLRALRVLKRAS